MTKLISHLSLIIALAGYAVSSGFFLHAFPQPKKRAHIQKAAFLSFMIASLMIVLALVLSVSGPYYSQSSGLTLIAALSAITVLAHFRYRIELMGIFVSPIATMILVYLAFSYPKSALHIQKAPPGGLAGFHISVSILGQAFAIIAFAISLLYLFQQRALKRKLFNFISTATPPLDKLERYLMISLWVGFICLSFGLISGAVYSGFYIAHNPPGLYWKVAWSLAVWVWYLAILLARNVYDQSMSVICRMSLIGFLLLVAFFFGLNGWEGDST